MMIYAFTKSRDIGVDGVDIEYLRKMRVEADCPFLFSTREQAALDSLDSQTKSQVFLKMWTCKEAFLKRVGAG